MSRRKVSPDALIRARTNVELTQGESAELVYVSRRSWQAWEGGERETIPLGSYELFLLKTKQATVRQIIDGDYPVS